MRKLITKEQHGRMLKNGRLAQIWDTSETYPVIKLFTPDASATWLLSEIAPDNQDIAFGLCDLGMGFPELGSVSLSEMKSVRWALGLPVERDLHFKADKTLADYADIASEKGRIIA